MTLTTLASLPQDELNRRLWGDGLALRVPPFVFQIKSPIPVVASGLGTLYSAYEVLEPQTEFVDFHVAVVRGRRFPRALCVFEMDGVQPFTPLAIGEAYAFLEWGMNWCVTSFIHKYVVIHAAVLERNGRVLIMPAPPGAGKSTLCAALVTHGWRLLSDEMALLDPQTAWVVPAPRPVSLKNQSIELIRSLARDGAFGPLAHNTLKGTVAHMRVPNDSLNRAAQAAAPGWVIFPRYSADASTELMQRDKASSLMALAENSFNYNLHGRAGFEVLADLIDRCACYDFSYSRLDEAIDCFSQLSSTP